jgi:hypothetical protein
MASTAIANVGAWEKLAPRSDPITEIVAQKVIEVASTGERDPERIRDLVLLALNEPGDRIA